MLNILFLDYLITIYLTSIFVAHSFSFGCYFFNNFSLGPNRWEMKHDHGEQGLTLYILIKIMVWNYSGIIF